MARDHMILSAFFFNPQGDHRMSWRHPRAPGREVLDFDFYRGLSRRPSVPGSIRSSSPITSRSGIRCKAALRITPMPGSNR